MADFTSAHTGNEIDAAVASGSTTTGIIKDFNTLSGSLTSTINVGGRINTLSHITASGDISASGTIFADRMEVNQITSSIVTSSVVFADGSNIFGDASNDTHKFVGNITASGNISASGTVFASAFSSPDGDGDIDFSDSLDVSGNITASGNISASGVISAGGGFDLSTTMTNGSNNRVVTATGTGAQNAEANLIFNGSLLEVGGKLKVSSHITASGNISGSSTSTINVGGAINTLSHITASGNISSSQTITATGNITTDASFLAGDGNSLIFSNGTVNMVRLRGQDGFLKLISGSSQTVTIDVRGGGHITASGNISASGTATVQNLNVFSPAGNTKIGENVVGNFDGIAVQGIITSSGNLFLQGDIRDVTNITASGNISGSSTSILTVGGHGNFGFPTSTSTGQVKIATRAADNSQLVLASAGNSHTIVRRPASTTDMALIAGDGERMRISSSGNVGIGTTSPDTLLHISGANNVNLLKLDAPKGNFVFSTNSTSGYTSNLRLDDTGMDIGHDSSARALNLQTNNADRLTILGDGKVGIGTSTPTKTLEVAGDISASGNLFVNKTLFLGGAASDFADSVISSSSETLQIADNGNIDVVIDKNNAAGAGIFSVKAHTGQSTRLIVSSSGNVGIGTVSPGEKLEVVGNISASGNVTSSGLHLPDDGKITIGDIGDLQISHNGSDSFIIDTGTGDLFIRAADEFKVQATSTNEDMIKAIKDGGIELYHNNSKILEVTSSGVNVTGHITASGNISSSGTITANSFVGNLSSISNLIANDGANRVLTSDNDGTLSAESAIIIDGAAISIPAGVTINSNDDDIAFQIKGSSDANLFQANPQSNDKIGIGTNTPPEKLTVAGNISASGELNIDHRLFDTGSTTLNTVGGGMGDIVKFGGTTTIAGAIYQLKGPGTWEVTDADAAASATGSLAVALGTNATTNGMLLRGVVKLNHDPGGAVGAPLYLAVASGSSSNAAPTGNNDIARIIGYNFDASGMIYFNPDNTFVEVSA